MKLLVFLSAGHGMTDRGGFDPGASSGRTWVELGLSDVNNEPFEEADFTRWFVDSIREAVEFGDVAVPDGIRLEFVPDHAVGGLRGRADWVERVVNQAKIPRWVALQVHTNAAARAGASGVEAIVGPRGDVWTLRAARVAVRAVADTCNLKDRGVKLDEQIGRKLFWVRRLRHGVIWEVGFIDNPHDLNILVRLLSDRDLFLSLVERFMVGLGQLFTGE